MQIEVSPSQRKDKKFKAVVDGSRTIHFGSKGASDFTLHGSEVRKQRYINRHQKTRTGRTQRPLASTPSTFCGTSQPSKGRSETPISVSKAST